MRLCSALLLAAALALQGGAACASNIVSDFSTVSNPSGEWAYGGWWSNAFHSGTSITNHRGYIGLNGWGNTDDTYYTPYVVQNTTNGTMRLFGAFDLAGQAVYFHPGNKGDEGTIRWTAPSAGSYNVALTFTKLDLVNDGPLGTQTVSVWQGSTFLGNSTLSAGNQLWTLSRQLMFTQGQELFIRVGANGNYDGDSTGIAGTIALVAEPSSLLALCGFTGVVGCMLRKRPS